MFFWSCFILVFREYFFFFFAYYHLVANTERCNKIYDTRPLFPRKLFKFPFNNLQIKLSQEYNK